MDSSQNVFWTTKNAEDYDSRAFDSGRITAHQWIASRAKLRIEKPNTISIELGCGTGVFAKTVGLRNIIGIDFSSSMLKIAQERMDKIYEKDIFNLQLEENSIDNVFVLFVVSDYSSNKKVELFKQIHAYLKQGGYFFFSAYSPNDEYFRDLDEIRVKESDESFSLFIEDESFYISTLGEIGFELLESDVLRVPVILEKDSRIAKAGTKLEREFIVLMART